MYNLPVTREHLFSLYYFCDKRTSSHFKKKIVLMFRVLRDLELEEAEEGRVKHFNWQKLVLNEQTQQKCASACCMF